MRKIRPVKVGNLLLDGKKIFIQSMLNVPTSDIDGNVEQAIALEKAGCDIIRVAVPDEAAAKNVIPALKANVKMPVVADIHFDFRLALLSVEAGADKIRLNPGNIGSPENVRKVAETCKAAGVPIRIGVNSGSVEKEILAKHGAPVAAALVESAVTQAKMLENFGFHDIVLSIKSSDVRETIAAYRLAADTEYPLHLGVTEAGTERTGLIKSAVGIGALLADGIGETVRVSLAADPVREIYAAKDILRVLGLYGGVKVLACPTCGRTKIDIIGIANAVETAVRDLNKDITVAVMGCAVNGPGEAKEADLGIAGGDGCAVIFKKGEIIRKVNENEIISELLKEIEEV